MARDGSIWGIIGARRWNIGIVEQDAAAFGGGFPIRKGAVRRLASC